MGSTTPPSATPAPSADQFPPANSPSLILTRPTNAERRQTWSLTHPMWGPALSHDDYLQREAYLTTVPLAKDGGVTHWILTEASQPPDGRPILSSCETLRKRVLCVRPGANGGVVEEGLAHAIGSVFTDPKFRGRGYASRMMREVGSSLRGWQVKGKGEGDAEEEGGVLFSVLYSDIGKTFYAKTGWVPFESSHAAFPPVPGAVSGLEPQDGYRGALARPIGYHELAELCNVDERLLRAALVKRVEEYQKQGKTTTCVALLPDLDVLLWHMMREDFVTKHIFGRTPAVKGAVYGEPGRRVWAVWTRGYYGGLEQIKGNTLHVLRVVVEDEEQLDEYLTEGFRAIVQIAQAEATEWRSQDVQMWNPTPRLRSIIEKSGLEYEHVDRDNDSIASLMWYGEGDASGLDWVANEKYGWC
ncbi:hypothetical protein B0H67DRAFT_490879 [Lasiosphaeris hirsuta]|uniref:LYC1 C-terminal domain-containing protein n=1 Tax=Lasiosphaeris hirsuta TaxID=260670 RepID=A0AA40AGC2_9PEZI|nr:hypothetical protein B0H67DRAFT_490879 [Lasiosphaeris hirsuta]